MKSDDDFGEDSEESFQESLGFNYNADLNHQPRILPLQQQLQMSGFNMVNMSRLSEDLPEIQMENQATNLNQSVRSQKANAQQGQSFNDSRISDRKQSVSSIGREEGKKEETKISKEEIEKRKNNFIQKYGYLDPILCQIVYEILNNDQKILIDEHSEVGFNKETVAEYTRIPYKIFSMYTHCNIIPKIWFYKNGEGEPKGPFMSYDMDIWNSREGFFGEDTLVSIYNEKFMPLQKYIIRDHEVIEIIDQFFLKYQQQQTKFRKKRKSKGQKNKKPYKNRAKKRVNNYQEDYNKDNFPALGDEQKKKSLNKEGFALLQSLTQKP